MDVIMGKLILPIMLQPLHHCIHWTLYLRAPRVDRMFRSVDAHRGAHCGIKTMRWTSLSNYVLSISSSQCISLRLHFTIYTQRLKGG